MNDSLKIVFFDISFWVVDVSGGIVRFGLVSGS